MQKIQVAQEKMKDSVEKLVDAEVEKADAEILDRREQYTASYSIGRIHPCHTKIRCEDA